MRKSLVLLTATLFLPVFDLAASSFNLPLVDTAEAFVARRTAVVVGPNGGVAVARRTAIGRPPLYYSAVSSTGRSESLLSQPDPLDEVLGEQTAEAPEQGE